jgi:hypothetical protein
MKNKPINPSRRTLKIMLDDFEQINEKNLDHVIKNFPEGEWNLLFVKLIIPEGATIEDRERAFFMVKHDCLDHKVISKESYGYQFIKTLYQQLVYAGH